jgi:hypothetical protein
MLLLCLQQTTSWTVSCRAWLMVQALASWAQAQAQLQLAW